MFGRGQEELGCPMTGCPLPFEPLPFQPPLPCLIGDNKHLDILEEGDGKVLPPDQKDTPPESENSASDDTEASSAGSSSEEEVEEDEEDEEDEEGHTAESDEGGAHDTRHEEAPDPEAGEKQNGVYGKPCCEKCKAIQNHDYEVVTPRKISRGRLQLTLACEGTYECAVTGLVFEVSQSVRIKYCVLSWSKFGSFLKDSWKFAGPIFDVDCDPAILKSIQFPHSLCLADEDSDVTFSVLHVKDSKPQIEPSVDHSGSHIKWTVTSLSPVGPIVQTSRPAQHHGVVLVYKEVGQQASYSFRVYLASNNDSDIKDIQNAVRRSNKKYVKLEKPPTCQRLLEERRKYRLTSDPEGDITPADFQFTLDVVKMKGYFEVFFELPPPFKLSLIEVDSDQPLWAATIREGDCVYKCEEKQKRKAERRKRSTSTSEEEVSNKRPRWADESDGVRSVRATTLDVTDQQLMKLAKCMGKEWRQVAISWLGLSILELDKLQSGEDDPIMQRFRMLDNWRRRNKGKAGLDQLHDCLNKDDVPTEVRDCLEDMLQGNCSS
ncbi:uncharacterized protein si:dkeyp-97b10.3 isoform X1 [Alosa sapidissima]|uniref:uncharacterized protein si:dkeyp-97b10.3 isoform X1 n=1 Tax=Alosa sapidissima TaxID=34773 RepID=UPI001C0934E4|nr:uncharacterized protein si:dkeyp-97b10.3 isoform X1 [Alosa sapidissima]